METTYNGIYEKEFYMSYWKDSYEKIEEVIPPNVPKPLVKERIIQLYVDAHF